MPEARSRAISPAQSQVYGEHAGPRKCFGFSALLSAVKLPYEQVWASEFPRGTVGWRLQSGEFVTATFTSTVRYLAPGLGLTIPVQGCPCACTRPNPTVLSAIDYDLDSLPYYCALSQNGREAASRDSLFGEADCRRKPRHVRSQSGYLNGPQNKRLGGSKARLGSSFKFSNFARCESSAL